MTTIAWDGYDLAADRLVTSQDVRGTCGYTKKIVRLENGGYVAVAGSLDCLYIASEWLDGRRDMPPDDIMKGSTVIYINPTGQAVCYDNSCAFPSPAMQWEVFGSGAGFALAALHAGKTAKEAVQIACRIDQSSGGKVDVVCVNPRPEKKVKKIDNTPNTLP